MADAKTAYETVRNWCWIGPSESIYLDELTRWMTDQVKAVEIEAKQSQDVASELTWQLHLAPDASPATLQRTFGKMPIETFVWSIGDAGVAKVLTSIAAVKLAHPQAVRVSTGLVSPAETMRLFEAGVQLHVQHPHQVKDVLDRLPPDHPAQP